ncbi:MAG: ATPase [Candidatus Aenigmarchaeota archaeon]|nr:ATPase [Candidatus Aenigmarchaeota archaeon]
MALLRVKSGIPGLDAVMQGGFITNSVNLISGGAGSGKTIFCAQYIWSGLEKGESGVFITLEEDPQDIRDDVEQFGWDFRQYEKKGLFKLIYHDPAQISNIGPVIIDEIKTVKAKRLVIDSTTVMGLTIDNLSQIRKRLYAIINAIKRSSCTALITSEIPEHTRMLSRFGVEEYVSDSVILLNYLSVGEAFNRTLLVRKMRRTNHGKDIYPFEISSKGITVRKGEL